MAAAVWLGSRVDGTRRLARMAPGGASARLAPVAVLGRARRLLHRDDPAQAAEQVVELLSSFAAELRAGAAPATALERCARDVTDPDLAADLAPVVEMMRLGAGGPAALRLDRGSRRPELKWLAAGWELADRHGVALAPPATRIAAAARDQLRHRSAVRAELAGARVSARMLALLPVVGLGLGAVLGADPVHVLVATPVGLACLTAALVLEYAGLRWTGALVLRAEAAG